LFDLVKELNKEKSAGTELAGQLGALLVKLGATLGVLQQKPEEFLQASVDNDVNAEEVEGLIMARKQARVDKNWAKADEIRDKLAQLKVVVEDGADGSSWRIER